MTVFQLADTFTHLKHPILWHQKIELVEFYKVGKLPDWIQYEIINLSYDRLCKNPVFRPILTVFRLADIFAHLKHPIFWHQKIELVEFYKVGKLPDWIQYEILNLSYDRLCKNPVFRPILTVFRLADIFAHLKHPIFWHQKIELVEFYRLVYYSYIIVHKNCTVICRIMPGIWWIPCYGDGTGGSSENI